ncbi:MAG TPA: amidohydrolase family protein [Mycoplana sp.]|nr:amidohydrolase family protein [Mycoplana sp.]
MRQQTPQPLLPIGSCDCHSHLYLPLDEFPVLPGQHFEANAGLGEYLDVCGTLGVSRHVIVQGKAYPGPDATLAAVSRLGADRSRAIIFPTGTMTMTDEQLVVWHEAGVRGFRFLSRAGEDVDGDRIAAAADRIAHLGWHVIVQAEADALARHYDRLASLPTPVVVDHLGRLPRDPAAERHALTALLGFLAKGGWIKISSPYNLTLDGASDFSSLADVVRSLVSAAPQKCIWGLNFPHPNLSAGQKPDETWTLRSLLKLLDSAEVARLFVTNPQQLYGFPAVSEGRMTPVSDQPASRQLTGRGL